MKGQEFKVGDRVRRINCMNTEYVLVGCVGTVTRLDDALRSCGAYVVVEWDNGVNVGGNDPQNSELISTAPNEETTVLRHPSSQRFHELLDTLGKLHDKKMQDYGRSDDPFANVRGSQEWGVKPWMGAMVRANDKVKRLQKFAVDGNLANESVMDSFLDLAGYALIAAVLYEEGK